MKKNSIYKTLLATVLAAVLALPAPVQAADSYVDKLVVEDGEIALGLDDIYMTDAEVFVVGDASTEITATSDNNDIAEVTELKKDEDGVTDIIIESYLKTGSAVITVETVGKGKNGKSLVAKINVAVMESVPDEPDDDDLEFDEVEKDTRPDGIHNENDGSVTTIKTVDGRQTITNEKVLSNGNMVETVTIIEANGDYSVVITTTDDIGNVIETKTYSSTTGVDGSITVYSESKKEDGSVLSGMMMVPGRGLPTTFEIQSVDSKHRKERHRYELSRDSASTLGKEPYAFNAAGSEAFYTEGASDNGMIIIPSEITLLDKDRTVLPVTRIEKGAIAKGTERVIVSENITKIATGAFEGSGTKIITFRDAVDKSIFEKNSLKGAGKKNGKGLTIYVTDKKYVKVVKKSLKTAGVKKAKVKVIEQ